MEELKQKLLQVVNTSNLSLEAIYYVTKDFFRDVDDAYQRVLRQERAKQEQLKNEMMQMQEASNEGAE